MAGGTQLRIYKERFAITGAFRISRGAKTEALVLRAAISRGDAVGHGECVPYARYGESLDSVESAIERLRGDIEAGLSRTALQAALPAGAARNALDAALWDLEAKESGRSAADIAGVDAGPPLTTAYTLSLEAPGAMGAAAKKSAGRPLLKLKLGGDGADIERIAAVVENAPGAKLIVDANEALGLKELEALIAAFAGGADGDSPLALIEQPLPADADGPLIGFDSPIPLCADEAAHDRASLPRLIGRYQAINIKLDKTGGLTEALALKKEAEEAGLKIMVGCMVGTSLAMAPAMLAAQGADFVDLDGPLLLSEDRTPPIRFEGSKMLTAPRALWG